MQSNPGKGRKRARRILLCGGGGFIAYSLPRIVLHLIHHFADDVQVVLSRAAAKMVSPYSLEVASRNRVFVEMDDTGDGVYVPHIELGRNIDLVVVFPATVNIMSKVANGITDELITGKYYEVPRSQEPFSKGNQLLDHFDYDWKNRRYITNHL